MEDLILKLMDTIVLTLVISTITTVALGHMNFKRNELFLMISGVTMFTSIVFMIVLTYILIWM
jgi:hypothetical protein